MAASFKGSYWKIRTLSIVVVEANWFDQFQKVIFQIFHFNTNSLRKEIGRTPSGSIQNLHFFAKKGVNNVTINRTIKACKYFCKIDPIMLMIICWNFWKNNFMSINLLSVLETSFACGIEEPYEMSAAHVAYLINSIVTKQRLALALYPIIIQVNSQFISFNFSRTWTRPECGLLLTAWSLQSLSVWCSLCLSDRVVKMLHTVQKTAPCTGSSDWTQCVTRSHQCMSAVSQVFF